MQCCLIAEYNVASCLELLGKGNGHWVWLRVAAAYHAACPYNVCLNIAGTLHQLAALLPGVDG